MLPIANQVIQPLPESELILNSDGSVYHLGVHGEQIGDDVIIVGDPDRVTVISSRFDKIDTQIQNREFHIHTGELGKRRISVISSGIGVDNIDILLNELDAAVNIDPDTRTSRKDQRALRIVRIGTSGTVQKDIALGSFLMSKYAIGMEGLAHHFRMKNAVEDDEKKLAFSFKNEMGWNEKLSIPYAVRASQSLTSLFSEFSTPGITLTANGFYTPQGRALRLERYQPDLINKLAGFKFGDLKLTNIEMECSGIYLLGSLLGHEICTICAILANRFTREFIADPTKPVSALVDKVLQRLTDSY